MKQPVGSVGLSDLIVVFRGELLKNKLWAIVDEGSNNNADVRRLIVIIDQEQSMEQRRNEQQLFEIKVKRKQSEFNLTHKKKKFANFFFFVSSNVCNEC